MIIFAGSLFTVVFTFFVGLLCGGVAWFIDYPSLLLNILPLIFFFYITRSGSVVRGYIKSSFKRNQDYGVVELEIIAAAIKNTVKFTLATGWVGFFSGIIAMLRNLAEPSTIGPSLSISLITVYYSITISYFIFFPVQVWVENKIMISKNNISLLNNIVK